MPANDFEETRAEIARRRLAELAATFNASLPEYSGDENENDETEDSSPRKASLLSRLHLKFLAVVAAVSLLLLAWWLLSGGSDQSSVLTVAQTADASSSASEKHLTVAMEPETLIVHVVGKVNHPGIVTVPAGGRVHDAIEAAGGLKGRVELAELNLARPLTDGEQVRVGLPEPLEPNQLTSDETGTGSGTSGKINVNAASQSELETLPGVGPVTAQAIIDWRQKNGKFRVIEDLLDVRGIGEATLDRLRAHVTL